MRLASLLVAVCLVSLPTFASELEGVRMPETSSVDGRALKLNGQGVRRYFVNVFVAGLYLEARATDGATLLSRDEARRIDIVMLRDADRKRFIESLRGDFEKNAAEQATSLRGAFDSFAAAIPDLKKGDSLTVTYSPGKGTRVEGRSSSPVAEGKAFADALFSVWVGKFPVDDGLKTGLLGAH